MLLQFRIKNAKSFRNEAILDFTASGISEHTEHVFEQNRNSVLPLVAVYGANASGKTNLVSSFCDMCDFIRTSVELKDEGQKYFFLFSSFIYDTETFGQPIEFEVTVSTDFDYSYGFSVASNASVISEYLEFRKTPKGRFLPIFKREVGEPLKIGKSNLIGSDERKELTFVAGFIRDKELLLTMLGRRQQTAKQSSLSRYARLYEWFSSVEECPECTNRKLNSLVAHEGTPLFEVFQNEAEINEFIKFVQRADPTIVSLSLENKKEEDLGRNKEEGKRLLSHRHILNYEEGETTLPTILESSGTKYIMSAYPIIRKTLLHGGLLAADEIDRSLHPSLLLDIINLFTDPETNPKHAQLLCTMHNVILMDRRFLRRDEIWFVEKNKEGESVLYSLADYNDVRNDADFCKNYILGKYGAVPEKM